MKCQEIALSGLLCALAVCALLLGGVIPGAALCGPMLAMAMLLPLREEYGLRTAGAAYVSVFLLGVLLTPNPESAWVFGGFGWYPLLQPTLNRIPFRLLRRLISLLLCNGVLAIFYVVGTRLTGVADTELNTFWMELLYLLMANWVFLLTDSLLTKLAFLWRRKLRYRLLHK